MKWIVLQGVGSKIPIARVTERLTAAALKKGQKVLRVGAEGYRPWSDLLRIPPEAPTSFVTSFLKGDGVPRDEVPSLAFASSDDPALLTNLSPHFDLCFIVLDHSLEKWMHPWLARAHALLVVLSAQNEMLTATRRRELELSYVPMLPKPFWGVAYTWGQGPQIVKKVEGNTGMSGLLAVPLRGKGVDTLLDKLSHQELEAIREPSLEELLQELRANFRKETTREMLQEEIRILLDRKGLKNSHLMQELSDHLFGLGPMETLLTDPEVTEIMVNGTKPIFVEKRGKIITTDLAFINEQELRTVIERILMPIGRRIDESQPMVDARLQDGSRVNAVIPPLALDGPILTIRRFSKKMLSTEQLIQNGAATAEQIHFLRYCVESKKNLLISGGTGTGKTTLLNIFSSFIPEEERIVTIEDAAELQLGKPHVVRLEAKPANMEGAGAVMIRDLVRNALRMRPDRIVVGECRGAEALDMLQAMNTGHQGSMTTIHANSATDAFARLETLVCFAAAGLPSETIQKQIHSAIDVVVQLARDAEGRRKIIEIYEV